MSKSFSKVRPFGLQQGFGTTAVTSLETSSRLPNLSGFENVGITANTSDCNFETVGHVGSRTTYKIVPGLTFPFEEEFLSEGEIREILESEAEHRAGKSKIFSNVEEGLAWLHSQ